MYSLFSLFLPVHVLVVTGISKAQGVDQTSHYQQRTAVRERDPTGQTTGLQQEYVVLSLMYGCFGTR